MSEEETKGDIDLMLDSMNLGLNASIDREWHRLSGIPFALPIEANFARDYHRIWFFNNWSVSVYISILYIIFVLITHKWMSGKQNGYDLRRLMSVWSTCLAIFSIVGTFRCLPEFVDVILRPNGMFSSYCESTYYTDLRLTFWYWMFVWSKVIELGDTVFIILRKQRLISLHWIHHVLTLSYAFFVIGEAPGTARWMVNMNFFIHSMMYSYYALKALRFNVSRSIAMTITITQITQMIFGLYININAFYYRYIGVKCDTSLSASAFGLFIYSLFFVLFIQFFAKTYMRSSYLRLKQYVTDNILKLIGAHKHIAIKLD